MEEFEWRRTTVFLSKYEHVCSCTFSYANHVTFFVVVEVNPSLTAGGYSLEFLVYFLDVCKYLNGFMVKQL